LPPLSISTNKILEDDAADVAADSIDEDVDDENNAQEYVRKEFVARPYNSDGVTEDKVR
jgi:hypothetical protein